MIGANLAVITSFKGDLATDMLPMLPVSTIHSPARMDSNQPPLVTPVETRPIR